MLLVLQMNWNKVSLLGLSLSLYEFTIIVLPYSLRKAFSCMWLTSKTKHKNLVYDLVRLLLGGEYFDGDFVSDEGNEIGDRVRL